MDDSNLGLIITAISLLTSLLPLLIVPLVIGFVLYRLKRGFGLPTSPFGGKLARLATFALPVILLPICLFCGLMVAVIGGVTYPPTVEVAAPWVCDGPIQLDTRNYSYKPGQHGTSMTYTCAEAQGAQHDVTLRLLGAATLLYSAILYALALVLLLAVRLLFRFGAARSAPTDTSGRPATVSGGNDSGIANLLGNMMPEARTNAALRDFLQGAPNRSTTTINVNGQPVSADSSQELLGAVATLLKNAGPGQVQVSSSTHVVEGDAAARLLRLVELHRSGALTDAEFEAKKARILREL
ncbi:SHOCT domain-containing protein [Thermomonas sp.]|uniref:SHOCT domain-containing protein n=1 Tax=Thermomonas sp. TaxID=1971895 RepID=UPI002602698B|nr:SHOCT domain-containing protein [Thermomonas sp.]